LDCAGIRNICKQRLFSARNVLSSLQLKEEAAESRGSLSAWWRDEGISAFDDKDMTRAQSFRFILPVELVLQWLLTIPIAGTTIPKDIGLGTPRFRLCH